MLALVASIHAFFFFFHGSDDRLQMGKGPVGARGAERFAHGASALPMLDPRDKREDDALERLRGRAIDLASYARTASRNASRRFALYISA